MVATRQLTVTLPEDLADIVSKKVASGEYESEAEVICHGLELLDDEATRIERWLREEVVPELEAARSDPSRDVSLEEVEAMLEEEYAKSIKKAG